MSPATTQGTNQPDQGNNANDWYTYLLILLVIYALYKLMKEIWQDGNWLLGVIHTLLTAVWPVPEPKPEGEAAENYGDETEHEPMQALFRATAWFAQAADSTTAASSSGSTTQINNEPNTQQEAVSANPQQALTMMPTPKAPPPGWKARHGSQSLEPNTSSSSSSAAAGSDCITQKSAPPEHKC